MTIVGLDVFFFVSHHPYCTGCATIVYDQLRHEHLGQEPMAEKSNLHGRLQPEDFATNLHLDGHIQELQEDQTARRITK